MDDPIGFAGGDVNLYGYVGNGPLGAVDPFGLEASYWNEIADSADDSIEYARQFYQPDPHAINTNTAVNFVSYMAHGTVDLLRVGNGIAEAYYCEETWEGRAAYVLMDIARASGIASIVLGGAVAGGLSKIPPSRFLTRPIRLPGREWPQGGKTFRVAPFGNNTTHPIGRWPHYHRLGPKIMKGKKKGQTMPGQSMKRHRPWESSPYDRSFWDRF